MILIGQYDSPFVRRVGIALTLYGMAFEHRPWSTFGDADKLKAFNPLTRVPTLVLDDGDVLIDSQAIIDYLDGQVPPAQRMFPTTEPDRHRAIKIAALATGVGDKAVSLFYEKRLHDQVSPMWVDRCTAQIQNTLAVLEADRNGRITPYWFGDRIGHADIALGAVWRFMTEAHPGLIPAGRYPALAAAAAQLEALAVFQAIAQRFIPPS